MSTERISRNARIFFVMGSTGSGKSTFITAASGQGHHAISHKLHTATSHIRLTKAIHPVDGLPVFFVDTPGFDDTFKSDVETLRRLADWLVQIYKKDTRLAGIVYLHRISDNRMSGAALKNLRTFASICGRDAMRRAILVTTMWGDIKEEVGLRREVELRDIFRQDVMDIQCRMERFTNTSESAWRIIEMAMGNSHSNLNSLLLQEDMDEDGRPQQPVKNYRNGLQT